MRIHQKVVYLWDYDKGGCYVNFFFCCMAWGQTGIGFDGVYETQVGER